MLRKRFMKDHVFSSSEHCKGPRECGRQWVEVSSHGPDGGVLVTPSSKHHSCWMSDLNDPVLPLDGGRN